MKTRLRHISKSALSILLTLCLLMSCLTVGLIATDAANIDPGEAVGAISSWKMKSNELTNWSLETLFSGNSGTSKAFDRGTTGSGDIHFLLYANEDGSDNPNTHTANRTNMQSNTSYQLTWGTEQEMVFKATKRYITFKISVSNGNNYVTITESDSSGSGDTFSPTPSLAYIHYTTDSTNWHDQKMDSTKKIKLTLSSACTLKFDLVYDSKYYKRNGTDAVPSSSSTSSTSYYAKTDGNDFSIYLSAGTYTIEYVNLHDNNETLQYKFYKSSEAETAYYIHYSDTDSGFGSSATSPNSAKMTQSGTSYTYTFNSGVHYFNINTNSSSNTQALITSNYTVDSGIDASTGEWGGYHYIRISGNNKMIVTYNSATKKITITFPTTQITVYGVANAKTIVTAGNVTVARDNTTVGANGNFPSGETAYVTVTPTNSSQKATTFTVGSSSYDLTPDGNGNYVGTFIVPANDAILRITALTNKGEYYIKAVPNNTEYGKVSARINGKLVDSSTKYVEGTAVELTASASAMYDFARWDSKIDEAERENTTATYYINSSDAQGDTITITGNFGPEGYKISINSGASADMRLLENGNYISNSSVTNGSNFYLIRKSDNYVSKNSSSSSSKSLSSVSTTDTLTWYNSSTSSYKYYNGTGKICYVLFDPATNNVWLTTDKDGYSDTTIYAKDGVIRDGSGGSGTTDIYGDTSITRARYRSGSAYVNKTVTKTDYSSRVERVSFTADEVKAGASITVSTTIKSAYTSGIKAMKVAAFNINGISYVPTVSGNTYTYNYTIPDYPDSKIEITPVYAVADTSRKTVRFYVTGVDDQVQAAWGNTIYCYAYYESGDSAMGTWPGQPMRYSNGRYFIDLPETNINNESKIKGISLSNGTWDFVHADLMGLDNTDKARNEAQRQTYDYNDFELINERQNSKKEQEPDFVKKDIIFEFKYKTEGLDMSHQDHGNFGTAHGDINAYPATINPSSFNQWEDLLDYYGDKTDIFGNVIDPNSVAGQKTPLRIVSQGYDYTTVGKYSTSWIIYQADSSGTYKRIKYVGSKSESELITEGLENESGWSDLKGIPALITFEYEIYKDKSNQATETDSQPAWRSDGQWYFSKVRDVNAHVLIEYGDSRNGDFNRDYFQDNEVDYTDVENYDPSKNKGLVTGASVYFNDALAESGSKYDGTENPTRNVKNTNKNPDGSSLYQFNITAEEDEQGKYTFIGWYSYDPTTGEANWVSDDYSYSTDVVNNEIFIARYILTPTGAVTISHTLLEGSEDLGKTLNSVQIVDAEDNSTLVATVSTNRTTSTTVSSRYIKANSHNSIKIVLNTEELHGSTFNKFYYDLDNSGKPAELITKKVVGTLDDVTITVDNTNKTATIIIPIASHFFKDGTEDGEKVFDTTKASLKFYSELTAKPDTNYEITFNYRSRAWGDQSYTAKGIFTDEQLENGLLTSGNLLQAGEEFTKFMLDNTPYEKNYRQEIQWDYTTALGSVENKQYVLDDGSTVTYQIGQKYDEDTRTLKVGVASTLKTNDTKVKALFELPYDIVDEDSVTPKTNNTGEVEKIDEPRVVTKETGYNSWFTLMGEQSEGIMPTFIEAPLYILDNGEKKYFSGWKIETYPERKVIDYCYTTRFNFVGVEPYYITAEFNGTKLGANHEDYDNSERSTSISFLENSRNQWNNNGGGNVPYQSWMSDGDKIFTDFALSFNLGDGLALHTYSGGESKNVKIGITLEQVAKVEDKKEDPSEYTSFDKDSMTQFILTDEASEKRSDGANNINVKIASNNDQNWGKYSVTDIVGNKDRFEYYYTFTKSQAGNEYSHADYIYRACSYIMVYEDDKWNVTFSDPIYFSISDIANK